MRPLIFSFLFLVIASPAHALTEAQAVERAMSAGNIQTLLEAGRTEAEGRIKAAGRWDNPEIEYSQEGLESPNGDSEERFWWLRQRLELAGSKGLQRDAAREQAQAGYARTALRRRDLVRDVRSRFYDALAAEETVQTLARYQARLKELASFVQQRVAAGDASRYDQLRLEQELALVEGDALTARADANAAREQLLALIGGEAGELTGAVLPPDIADPPLEQALRDHPLLQALEAESESQALTAEAARREAWPEVTVGIGRREADEPSFEADGNTFSLGVEIPLFDRGSGEAQIASSRARQRRSEYALAAAQLRADFRSTRQRLEAQRRAAIGLQSAVSDGSLAAIAESAYGAGEVSIMELIDAHRTALATRQAFVKRALDARNTFIQLQHLRGQP